MSEDRLQSEVIRYIQLQYPKVKYCASLGGIYTSPTQSSKAKRNGYVRGMPDLQIMEARTMDGVLYHGLFIEIKTYKGTATQAQKEWIDALQERGYKAEICKGLPAILDLLDNYLQ
tara:strand:+ start:344 stop:691 length:348 start_codon:yes stop_codon:yes gene_type:complete